MYYIILETLGKIMYIGGVSEPLPQQPPHPHPYNKGEVRPHVSYIFWNIIGALVGSVTSSPHPAQPTSNPTNPITNETDSGQLRNVR